MQIFADECDSEPSVQKRKFVYHLQIFIRDNNLMVESTLLFFTIQLPSY